MGHHILQCQSLECLRNEQQLFVNLSFQIQTNEILYIEGPNGSGKTTLLRILCGLRQADDGQILWDNDDIVDLSQQYTAQITYIGHYPGVKRDLTVLENLRMVQAMIATKSSLDLESLLEEVHLFEYGDHLAGHLSAGQQRRIALARLIMSDTPLWILDEPYTSLDRGMIKWLESLFMLHVKAGGMIVMTSHQTLHLQDCQVVSLRLGT